MMKRIAIALLLVAVLFLAGCPSPLTTGLPSDLVLVLGRFSPAQGVTEVRGAVGGSIEVPVLIADQTGRAAAGDYDVAFTLSADADLSTEGDNIAAGTQTITAGSESVVTITVPGSAVAAVYTLFGVLDATDAAANNNTSSIQVDIGATNSPDLEITMGSVPSFADPGSTITVGYSISNTGFAKVAADSTFTVQFVVNLSGTDEEMAADEVTLNADLYPQESVTRQLEVSVPTLEQMAADQGTSNSELDDFDVNYQANVDPDDAVAEIVEGDSANFTVASGNRKPDLVMDDIILPDGFVAAKPGGAAQLTLRIENDGAASSGEYGIDLYVDIDGNDQFDDGTDYMIHQWAQEDTPAVPYDLSGGGNNRIFVNTPADTTYDANIPAGTYDIRAELVTTIDEYDTGNNDEQEFNVDFVENLFNLSMKYMSTTLTSAIVAADGGDIPLTYILENDGTDPVEADFDVTFYASDDGTLVPAGDIDLGTQTVTDTVPGKGSLRQTYTASMPAASGAAFYTLYWVIDSGDVLAETDEGDNDPNDAEDAYVFPIVSDGTTALDTRLLVYKPQGDDTSYNSVRVWYYDTPWSSSTNSWWATSTPGTLYGSLTRTLDSESQAGIRVRDEWGYYDIPVTLRVVPEYVNELPDNAIPTNATVQDGFEPNNSQDDARQLSSATSPLYGFTYVWVDYSSDRDDYFTFDVP